MVYVLLADGFEEIEALAPVDLLRRSGSEVVTVSCGEDSKVFGSHGITVTADRNIKEITDCKNAELLVLPGGMPGTLNLDSCEGVHRLITSALSENIRIAAICAAPMILGKREILKGKNAVCYPGFEEYLTGATVSNKRVVTDGLITTAKGAGAAVDFALELIALIHDEKTAENIRNGIFA